MNQYNQQDTLPKGFKLLDYTNSSSIGFAESSAKPDSLANIVRNQLFIGQEIEKKTPQPQDEKH